MSLTSWRQARRRHAAESAGPGALTRAHASGHYGRAAEFGSCSHRGGASNGDKRAQRPFTIQRDGETERGRDMDGPRTSLRSRRAGGAESERPRGMRAGARPWPGLTRQRGVGGPSCRRRRGPRRPSRPLRRRQVFRSSFYLRSGAALQQQQKDEGAVSTEQQSLMKSARSRFIPVSSPIPILELESRFWMLLLMDSSKPSAKSTRSTTVRERREVESLERVRVV